MNARLPEPVRPVPVTVNPDRTAVLVLDGSLRWGDPDLPCYRLGPVVGRFLARAREQKMFIVYTVSFHKKGRPEGQVFPAWTLSPPNRSSIRTDSTSSPGASSKGG